MSNYDTRGLESGPTDDAQPVSIADPGDRIRVSVAGGTLIYEGRGLGKELVGFEDVTDWDALAEGLAARGHDRGAVFHLPELDDEDPERGA